MAEYCILRNRSNFLAFQDMTFPMYRAQLEIGGDAYSTDILVGATTQNAPVGLAYATISSHSLCAELISVYVEKRYRNQGVATALVHHVCKELTVRGVTSVRATYIADQSGITALEHVFAKTGFSSPRTRMVALNFDLDSIRGAPGLNLQMAREYFILPWIEVPARERTQLMTSQEREHWIPSDLIPFDFESDCEPVTSLALQHRKEIVGWCITHKVSDVLRFTCSFVRRDLAKLGRGLIVFSEAIKRMPLIGVTVGMCGIPLHHSSFASFARRRLQPYCIFFSETRGVAKVLHEYQSSSNT